MIPILFDRSETAFTSNGVCRLIDCLSCTITEERNGIYECEFSYSVTGKNFEQIRIGRIIYATHDDTQTPQPFDIYKRSANIDGTVTFYARHIAYRLANIILKPFQASSCAEAVAGLKTHTINTNPFTFWTDKSVTANFKLLTPRSVWSTLGGQEGSILDVYGKGTYEFDKWTVRLHLNRGRKTDVQIRYGKNLTEFELEQEAGGPNAYVPFWKSSEGDTVVTVPGWVVMAPDATALEHLTTETLEVITNEAGIPIDVKAPTGAGPDILDLSDAFEEEPTPEQLRAEALQRLNDSKPWEPGENLRINFAALWQTPEYESVAALQRVRLCDTVSVYFPAIDYVARDVQIIKTVYNTLLERFDSMELGQPAVTLASLIKHDVEQTVLRQVPTNSAMAQAIDEATKLITGGTGGHVVLATDGDGKPNEILIMDTEDISTAVKVLRINQNGIGFSSSGYNGPFTTAWTLDGHFVADFITTGTLNANIIKSGVLSDASGRTTFNLESGVLTTKKFVVNAENFQLSEDGTMHAQNAVLEGTLENYYTDPFTAIRSLVSKIDQSGLLVQTSADLTQPCIIDLRPGFWGGMLISKSGSGSLGLKFEPGKIMVGEKIADQLDVHPTAKQMAITPDKITYNDGSGILGYHSIYYANGQWNFT